MVAISKVIYHLISFGMKLLLSSIYVFAITGVAAVIGTLMWLGKRIWTRERRVGAR